METVLRRWWIKKYKLPWTHECAQASTLEDLLVEFYEDVFEEDPAAKRKALAKDGEFYFKETGDELIDKWERELAMGLDPDLEEGMDRESKEKLQLERERKQNNRPHPLQEDTSKFTSRFASPGSNEERQLLGSGKPLGAGKSEWADLLKFEE